MDMLIEKDKAQIASDYFFRPSSWKDINWAYWGLLFILYADAFGFSMLFTFVTFFVTDLGIPANDVGWYSGYLTSGFYLGQVLTCFLWGHLSDTYGRKPFLLLGATATCCSIFLLGISVRFWQALLARFLGGCLNSNWPMAKNYINDLSTPENRTRVLSSISLMWGFGTITGPFFGGVLSQLALKRPALFSDTIVAHFPYLLPCLLGSTLSAASVLWCFFAVPESLSLVHTREISTEEPYDGSSTVDFPQLDDDLDQIQDPHLHHDESTDDMQKTNMKTEDPTWTTEIIQAIVLFGSFSIADIGMHEVFPAWAMLDPSEHGISLTTSDLGILWALGGVSLLIFQTWFFVPLCNRFGTRTFFQIGSVCGFIGILIPLAYQLLPLGSWAVWSFIIVLTIFRTINGTIGFSVLNLHLNTLSNPLRIGLINGTASTSAGLSRAVGPFLATIIFAWSLDNGMSFPLNYWLVFILFIILTIVNVIQSSFLSNLCKIN